MRPAAQIRLPFRGDSRDPTGRNPKHCKPELTNSSHTGRLANHLLTKSSYFLRAMARFRGAR